MSRWRAFSIAAVWTVITLAVVASAVAWYVHRGLDRAERYATHQLWTHARAELYRFLWLHPQDARGNILMAEAIIKDESFDDPLAVDLAIEHLQRVPRNSSLAAEAYAREGRLRLFLKNQPARAEDCLKSALQLNGSSKDAHYVLWKLYDLTGRSHQVEPIFWKVYELAPVEERGERLREWYMSQFFPLTANPRLEVAMGFIAPGQIQTPMTEATRLLRFRRSEPDRPLAHAALARWFRQEGDPQYGNQLMVTALETQQEYVDSFVVSTMVSIQMDLGEFEKAESWWKRWPEPREGYDYWLATGNLYEQHFRDDEKAAEAFEKALSVWPGPTDWQTQHRYVNCLRRQGQHERAELASQQSKKVEKLCETELHVRLRNALNVLDDPLPLTQVVQFYDDLGRPLEAQCWREHIAYVNSLQDKESATSPDRKSTTTTSMLNMH